MMLAHFLVFFGELIVGLLCVIGTAVYFSKRKDGRKSKAKRREL